MRFLEHQEQARGATRRLLAGFTLAVLATVAGVHAALALVWWACSFVLGRLPYPEHFFAVNVGVTLLLILGGWWIETSNLQSAGAAERLARRFGAREARPGNAPAEQRLCNIVDEVAIAAHMPRPHAMVLPRVAAINAFAAGWGEEPAIVAVSQGALDLLTRDELQGMVAHECSHIREGDTQLNMQVAGMVLGLELVHHFGDTLRQRDDLLQIMGWPIWCMGSFGLLAGRVLQAAVSRQREFLADARTLQWTRSRDGLGGVLRKVLGQQRHAGRAHGADEAMAVPSAMRHLLLVPEAPPRGGWLATHPPLEERIRRVYGRTMPPIALHDAPAATPFDSGPVVSPGAADGLEWDVPPAAPPRHP